MRGGEFAKPLAAQCSERGRLLIHLHRKPLMRLCTGFDGGSGAIREKSGIAQLNRPFRGNWYSDDDPSTTPDRR